MTRALLGLSVLSVAFCACSERWVDDAHAAQARAEAAAARGDFAEARTQLRALADGALLDGASAEIKRALRQDAFYQLARWSLASEQPAQGVRDADAGLALGGEDIYVANLWIVRAQAHEALGEASQASNDYHRALLINETLLDAVLEETP